MKRLKKEFFYDEIRDGFYIPGLIKRAWGAQLIVLSEIDRICKKYDIAYFLYGGTLLGAVRDGQCIPWDDDLDICMLRDDFFKFAEVVKKELPEELTFNSLVNNQDSAELVAAVGTAIVEIRPEIREKYYEFLYPVSVDIFPLDDLAKDPEDEEYRKDVLRLLFVMLIFIEQKKENTAEFKKEIKELEKLLQIQFDRTKSLKTQIYALFDKISQEFNGEGGQLVSYLPDQLKDEKNYYLKTIMQPGKTISFCGTQLPVPLDCDAVLQGIYGDYHKKVKAGGDHGYPYFKKNEKLLKETFKENWLQDYAFKEKDLERPEVYSFRDIVLKTAEYFIASQKKSFEAFVRGDFSMVLALLSKAQEEAITLGNTIEQKKGTGTESVSYIEEYCEALYHAYQSISELLAIEENPMENLSSALRKDLERKLKKPGYYLRKLHSALEKEFKRQVVFFPHSAKHFDSLRPLIDSLSKAEDVECTIIPIPYFDRLGLGEFSDMHYEGENFPKGYNMTDYRSYDFAKELPDCIVINSPYDEFNHVWSVDPFFYSREMKNYTKRLVYIPWFITDEINPVDQEDGKAFSNMEYYVTVPGIFHADLTIVQSGQMKKTYLEKIARFAGRGISRKMSKKISGAGSCLLGEKEGQGTKELVAQFRRFLFKK